MKRTVPNQLWQLARFMGLQTAYYDIQRRRKKVSVDSLKAVLGVLGVPLDAPRDIPRALREQRLAHWRLCLEPVNLAWDSETRHALDVRLPQSALAGPPLEYHLTLESGERRQGRLDPAAGRMIGQPVHVEGETFGRVRLDFPERLPLGYHQLELATPCGPMQATVISAPRRAYTPRRRGVKPYSWGAFMPIYALRTATDWGAGNFGDYRRLIEWLQGEGAGVVATLPVLAQFLGEDVFEYSPYNPASKLFWNEFYLDPAAIPELARCGEARSLMSSDEFRAEIERLRALPLVDYAAGMALRYRVLRPLADCFFEDPGTRQADFERFLKAHPQAEDYARFRAAGTRQGTSWPVWPEAQRAGQLTPEDYDQGDVNYHLYVQWQTAMQVESLGELASRNGPGLYLDMPLGVHSDSYDVWRERDNFALGVSGGAPPDPFFTKGQNWGFPPLHPQRIRRQGYRYVINCYRHIMSMSGILRVDHVMGLHRFYWVPSGFDATDGVYMRYPADELYALLTLESHRNKTMVVGEDLGTVPRDIRKKMVTHGFRRLFVGQFELSGNHHQAMKQVLPSQIASLNTHDLPTFSGFWNYQDIHVAEGLGLYDAAEARQAMESRWPLQGALCAFLRELGWAGDAPPEPTIMAGLHKYLAGGPARVMLVNLEDLWLEQRQQNVPGTWREKPNWRNRAALTFEEFTQRPEVLELLREIDRLRRQAPLPQLVEKR